MLNLPKILIYMLIVLVSLVWAATIIAGIFEEDYQPPSEIHALFAAMITALVITRRGGDDDDKDDRDRRSTDEAGTR